MPPLNWDAFAQLPGAAEDNFEMLCRALVRRHYVWVPENRSWVLSCEFVEEAIAPR